MAEYTGKDGAVLLNTTTVAVTGWDYTGTIDTYETTTVSSADKSYTQGPRDGSGSITFNTDSADASQKVIIDQLLTGQTPGKVLLQLYVDLTGTDQFYFSAVIESVALTQAATALQTWTASYKKTGALYHVPTT